jgi:hypothetical protein
MATHYYKHTAIYAEQIANTFVCRKCMAENRDNIGTWKGPWHSDIIFPGPLGHVSTNKLDRKEGATRSAYKSLPKSVNLAKLVKRTPAIDLKSSKKPEASFLKQSSRLRRKLLPTQEARAYATEAHS